MTKFSLVLPAYNVGDYIDRCLSSCVNQSFKDFDVVVVDDCSQDDSIEKAKSWAEKDSRIKVVYHQRNLGTYHARHTGALCAKGEYIVFVDPDDALEPNALDLLNDLSAYSPDIFLFSIRVVPPKKFYQTAYSVPNFEKGLVDVEELLTCRGFAFGTPGKAYKKELVLEAFKDLSVPASERLVYGEDALLFSKILEKCRSVRTTPERIYVYMLGQKSITQVFDAAAIDKKLSQLSFVIDKLAEEPASYSAKIISQRLRLDKLFLLNKLDSSFSYKCLNYIEMIRIQKNIRPLIKLGIFILTFGRKSL